MTSTFFFFCEPTTFIVSKYIGPQYTKTGQTIQMDNPHEFSPTFLSYLQQTAISDDQKYFWGASREKPCFGGRGGQEADFYLLASVRVKEPLTVGQMPPSTPLVPPLLQSHILCQDSHALNKQISIPSQYDRWQFNKVLQCFKLSIYILTTIKVSTLWLSLVLAAAMVVSEVIVGKIQKVLFRHVLLNCLFFFSPEAELITTHCTVLYMQ